MPGAHSVFGAQAVAGGTQINACIGRGVLEAYFWDRLIWSFDMAMDSFMQLSGLSQQTYEELQAELAATPECYWIARCYANYDNDLVMYIWFSQDPGMIHHHVLKAPMQAYMGGSSRCERPLC